MTETLRILSCHIQARSPKTLHNTGSWKWTPPCLVYNAPWILFLFSTSINLCNDSHRARYNSITNSQWEYFFFNWQYMPHTHKTDALKRLTQKDEPISSCDPVTEGRSLWSRCRDAQLSDGHCRGLWWNWIHTSGFHSEPLLVCLVGFSCKFASTQLHKLHIASISQTRATCILLAHMEMGHGPGAASYLSKQVGSRDHRRCFFASSIIVR